MFFIHFLDPTLHCEVAVVVYIYCNLDHSRIGNVKRHVLIILRNLQTKRYGKFSLSGG